MDRRRLPVLLAAGVAIGALGVILGTVGAVLGQRLLGLGAGLAALGSAVCAVVLAGQLRRAELAAADREADLRVAEAEATLAHAHLDAALDDDPDALAIAEAILTSDHDEERGPESVFDPETGMLDERVFVVSFERKVAAARRHLRPLGLVLVDIEPSLPTHPYSRVRALTRFGEVARETLRDCDIACRVAPTIFGFILEDTAESGAVWAAERLQMALNEGDPPLERVVAGVASYPSHGLAAQHVLTRAQDALNRARVGPGRGLGTVEVATEDPG